MKVSTKINAFLSALAVVSVASLAGAVSGSLAWYSYQTRSTVAFKGTSAFTSELLQVGIISETDFRPSVDDETLGIEEVVDYKDGKKIYFVKPGSKLPADTINAYLATTSYSRNATLEPITSRKYSNSVQDFSLYESPRAFLAVNEDPAEKGKYCVIPFAFRVLVKDGGNTPTYVKHKNIWLTDAETHVEPSHKQNVINNIDQAIRVHFKGKNQFILNPSATSNGSTKLAGLLSLHAGSGYYDSVDGKEIMYGDYSGDISYQYNEFESADNVNENHTNNVSGDESSTFYAKHAADTYIYTNYEESLQPDVAEYYSMSTIAPVDRGGGNLDETTGLALCDTGDDGVATVDTTIWLEGWDHSVIDNQRDHKFALGLKFQINR